MSISSTPTSASTFNDILDMIRPVMGRVILLTVLLSCIFTSLYYFQFKAQLENQRSLLRSGDIQFLDIISKQSDQQFKLLQNLINSLSQVIHAVQLQDTDRLVKNFAPYWPELEKNNQLKFIGFYNLNGKHLADWSKHSINSHQHQLFGSWVDSVKKTGKNLSTVACQPQCNQYSVSSLFLNNIQTGYLVTGISMPDRLNYFNNNANRISGILSPAEHPETSTDILVYKWGYSINGASITKITQSKLEDFTKILPAISGNRQTLTVSLNQREYELNFYPLKVSDNSLLIVIDDVSAQIKMLITDTFHFSLITFIVLLISLSFLLLIRIRVNQVPHKLLNVQVKEDKSITNKLLPAKINFHKTEAKNDIIFNPVNDPALTSQLNLLKQYNEDINLELARQMININREKDLIRKILDNSQAIIMRLKTDGSILSINNFGEKITGYSIHQLSGKNFIDLYPEDVPFALKDLEKLSSIITGDQQLYEHEAHLNRKDGKECIILWKHTKLKIDDGTSNTQILATGLDITHLKKLEKNMSWLLNHDNLTSLFNRRRFEKELDSALNWSKKYQADGCLLTIDLENFKDINDCCGHEVGDILLRKVASMLKEITREIDTFSQAITARLGGDEFAIILRNVDEEGAVIISKRILKALNNISHFHRQVSFQLSSSIGIATFSVANKNSTELLSNANYARNKAKLEGRNQYYIFKAEHSHLEQTHHRMMWRDRIESALKNNLFILYYQPILNIQQNNISHYETLIRMLDENENIISPGLFIHIAERFGLIQQIDSFIIASAIAKQGELIRQGHDITLTINLSAKAFDDSDLFNKINLAIQLNEANPEYLVFEITETGALSNIINAEKMMLKIQTLGCKFALDDFGIGFSSFNYLRKLPFDYVKIDGSFITDLENNSDNKVLVQALSEVAIGFNKLTVAEFVDSRQTLDLLKQAKINYAQGYFIGKPSEAIPVEIPDFFHSHDKLSVLFH